MSKTHHIIFLAAALAAACTGSARQDDTPSYDFGTDCLNGTMIVEADGKYGLADTSGKEILPPRFDDIIYLTDEVGAAFTGNVCSFFDKSGKRLGESIIENDASADRLLGIYTAIRSEQRARWDSILSDYEEFLVYCRSDGATKDKALMMAETIRAALAGIDTPMEKDQTVRFESVQATYKK